MYPSGHIPGVHVPGSTVPIGAISQPTYQPAARPSAPDTGGGAASRYERPKDWWEDWERLRTDVLDATRRATREPHEVEVAVRCPFEFGDRLSMGIVRDRSIQGGKYKVDVRRLVVWGWAHDPGHRYGHLLVADRPVILEVYSFVTVEMGRFFKTKREMFTVNKFLDVDRRINAGFGLWGVRPDLKKLTGAA